MGHAIWVAPWPHIGIPLRCSWSSAQRGLSCKPQRVGRSMMILNVPHQFVIVSSNGLAVGSLQQ